MAKRTHGQTKEARAKSQQKYNKKPEQIERRGQRNKSRALMVKAGRVRKGDGRDVDHNNHNTADNTPTNLSVRSKSENRADGGPPKKSGRMVKTLLTGGRKKNRG